MFKNRIKNIVISSLVLGLMTTVSPAMASIPTYLSDPNFQALTSALFSTEMASKDGLDMTERVDRTYPAPDANSANVPSPLYYLDLNVQTNIASDESVISIVRGRTTSTGQTPDTTKLGGYLNKLYFTSYTLSDLGSSLTQADLNLSLTRLNKSGAKYVTSTTASTKGVFAIYEPATTTLSYGSLESRILDQLLTLTSTGSVINPVSTVDNSDGSKTYTVSATKVADQPNNSNADKITYTVGTDNLVTKLFTYTTNTDSTGKAVSYDVMSITNNVLGKDSKVTLGSDFTPSGSIDVNLLSNMVDLVNHENYSIKALGLLYNAASKDAKVAGSLSKDSKVTPLMIQKAVKNNLPLLSIDKAAKITLTNTKDGVKMVMTFGKSVVTRFIHVSNSVISSLSVK